MKERDVDGGALIIAVAFMEAPIGLKQAAHSLGSITEPLWGR